MGGGGGGGAVVAWADEPSDVYAVEGGELRKLTESGGSWFGPFQRTAERLSITHPEGHDIEAWLLAANDKREKAPLLIDVHGGPHSPFGSPPGLEVVPPGPARLPLRF